MFANFNANRLVRGNNAERTGLQLDLINDLQAEPENEFSEEKTTGEYGDNQFWKSGPDEFDLDALMADMWRSGECLQLREEEITPADELATLITCWITLQIRVINDICASLIASFTSHHAAAAE